VIPAERDRFSYCSGIGGHNGEPVGHDGPEYASRAFRTLHTILNTIKFMLVSGLAA
jgi:hypothetical protein